MRDLYPIEEQSVSNELWDHIEAVGAKSKRPDLQGEQPARQPMRPRGNGATQKAPSADQKRVRREMARQAGYAILTPDGKPLWDKVHDTEEEAQAHFDQVKGRTDMLVPKDIASYKVGPVKTAGYDGWNNGAPNPMFPGETMLSCPKCGGAATMQGMPLNDRFDAGATNLTCQDCGFTQYFPGRTKESAMITQHTEADLLAKMAGASTLAEQSAYAAQLQQLRDQRRDQIAASSSLDWGAMTEIDLQPSYTAPVLPAATASLGRSQGGLDWLDDIVPTEHDMTTVANHMRAEATVWYEELWGEVKADGPEFRAQAHNAARRTASRYGFQAEAAASVFVDTAAHLYRKEAADKAWGTNDPFDQPDEKVQEPPYQMDNGSKLEHPDDKTTFDEIVNGERPASDDPKTDRGDSPSLKEGDQPAGDRDEDGTQGAFEDSDRGTHDKSSRDGNWGDDALPTGGKGNAATGSRRLASGDDYEKTMYEWGYSHGERDKASGKTKTTWKAGPDGPDVDVASSKKSFPSGYRDAVEGKPSRYASRQVQAGGPGSTCDICKYENGKEGVPAVVDGKTVMGPWANMCEKHFQSHGVGLGTGKGQRLEAKSSRESGFNFFAALRDVFASPGAETGGNTGADSDPKTEKSMSPSLQEGDQPEGDHSESPVQETPSGDLDASTWGGDPDALDTGGSGGNAATSGPMEGTPTVNRTSGKQAYYDGDTGRKDVCHCGQPIEMFDGAWYHLRGAREHDGGVYPATPKEKADAESKTSSLATIGQRIASNARTSNVIVFGEALARMSSLNDRIDAFSGRDIVRMVLASGDVSEEDKKSLENLEKGDSDKSDDSDDEKKDSDSDKPEWLQDKIDKSSASLPPSGKYDTVAEAVQHIHEESDGKRGANISDVAYLMQTDRDKAKRQINFAVENGHIERGDNGRLFPKKSSVTAANETIGEGPNTYKAFWQDSTVDVKAETTLEAQKAATEYFQKGTRKTVKSYDVTVMLAAKGDEQVTHAPLF